MPVITRRRARTTGPVVAFRPPVDLREDMEAEAAARRTSVHEEARRRCTSPGWDRIVGAARLTEGGGGRG